MRLAHSMEQEPDAIEVQMYGENNWRRVYVMTLNDGGWWVGETKEEKPRACVVTDNHGNVTVGMLELTNWW